MRFKSRELAAVSLIGLLGSLPSVSANAQVQAPDPEVAAVERLTQPSAEPIAGSSPRVAPEDTSVNSAPKADADKDKKLILEEIVVTADRKKSFSADLVQAGSFRGARQLDTPLTVAVIPRELINSQQALSLLDALRNTAGVTSSQNSPTVYTNIAIRGIAVENRGNYRLNGSLPIINLTDLPLEDKERVEALKGASALYYGFTSPSGIVNLTMKRPTAEPFATATMFGNNHGSLGGHADVGGTTGIFGYRVNAVYSRVDVGIDNTRGSRSLVAGAFDLRPSDRLTISFDAEHIFKKVIEPGTYRFTTLPAPTLANPAPSVLLPPLIRSSTNFGPDWGVNRTESTNLLARVNYKISDTWNVSVDAGTSRLRRDRINSLFNPTNLTTGEGTLTITLAPNNHLLNKNLRAELAGTFYTGPLLHEILVGASRNKRTQYTPINVTARPCVNAAGAAISCTQNIFNPRVIPEVAFQVPTFNATSIDDIGVYIFDRIKIGDWLQILGGVRKSDYTESNISAGTTTFKAKPTAYSYGAVVKPKNWISLYGTYIEGLESTPSAPLISANAGQQLPPSKSRQKEAGIKIEPKKGLLFQAAYFDINRATTFINTSNIFVKSGRATFKGLELSLTGEITRDFSVYASALLLSAKQTSGAPDVITRNAAGVVTAYDPTLVGRRIENTARRTYSIAGEYRLTPLVPGLSVTAAVYHIGNRAIDALNRNFIPGYTLFDAGIAFRTTILDHTTTFRINGQNIGGKRYFASTGVDSLAQGAPSVVKFSISSTF